MSQASERDAKITALIASLAASDAGKDLLERALKATGHAMMRTVESVRFPEIDAGRLANARTGVVLDSETTGLDPKIHGVTQLAMLKFRYDDGGIIALGEEFDRLRDPGHPIPPEVTDLTGITDEMVAGKVITDEEVATFLEDVDLVIAHNAGFDRRMCETCFPAAGFQALRWDCSVEQIDWKGRNMPGKNLELIALRSGLVYGAHNALNDIRCLALMLNHRMGDGPTAFAEMLAKGNVPKIHIAAKGSIFDKKDDLKKRKYIFSDEGVEALGNCKCWHTVIDGTPEAMAEEAAFLLDHYGRHVSLPAAEIRIEDRYSDRMPMRATTQFRTEAPETVIAAVRQFTAAEHEEICMSYRF